MALQQGKSGAEADKFYLPMHAVNMAVMAAMLYWHCYGLWKHLGVALEPLDNLLMTFYEGGLMNEYKMKAFIILMTFLMTIVRSGGTTKKSWTFIIVLIVLGLAVFLVPFLGNIPFIVTSIAGYIMLIFGFGLLGRKSGALRGANNDDQETFEQCDRLIETDDSINFRTRYKYKGKWHNGWVNVVNPYRASLIMGLPGAGKSYAIYYPFIDQAIRKGYTAFLYDYKFDDLTQIVYNKWLQYYPGKWKTQPKLGLDGKPLTDAEGHAVTEKVYIPPKDAPQFCILNFDDPRKSMRCNPLNPKYLKDTADANEVADIIMKNVNPKGETKEDFFSMSAKVYVAALVWLLKKYNDGAYCTFPHLIELMGKDYQKVFKILQKDNELATMIRPFASALEKRALEQLEGQIASATIPLLKFPSPMLYWALTGDDFELDLNNPDAPKIICMGNNPDRQAIYGTALALYTSRIFKVINHKYNAAGKRNRKCIILLDELPTIFIKGLDNLIATARSNKVAIVLGAQDKSQLVRDYSRDEATVIFNTVGNIFAGQVNGETARDLSASFGKEFREQGSETTGGQSDTITRSFQLQELLPQSRIETLSQGEFCGRIADDAAAPIAKKLFCGKVVVDTKARSREEERYLKTPEVGLKYFDFEKVERDVRKDAEQESRMFIEEELRTKHQKIKIADPYYNLPSDLEVDEIVEETWTSMDDAQREAFICKVIEARKEEHMKELIYDNYKNIQGDIDRMFEFYHVDEEDEVEDDGDGGGGDGEGRADVETGNVNDDDFVRENMADDYGVYPNAVEETAEDSVLRATLASFDALVGDGDPDLVTDTPPEEEWPEESEL